MCMYVRVCYGGVWVCVHTSGHGTYMHVCTGTVCASMLFMGVHVYHACVPCMGQVYVHVYMCTVLSVGVILACVHMPCLLCHLCLQVYSLVVPSFAGSPGARCPG